MSNDLPSASRSSRPAGDEDPWPNSARSLRRSRVTAALAALGIALTACGSEASGPVQTNPTPTPSPTPTPTGQVSISNGKLTRNGVAWTPRGYFQVAFEAGSNVQQADFEANANAGYTPQEYSDMVAAHADSVRLMISQPGADPQDSLYDPTLVPKVIAAIKAARVAGLTVIIGIQDEKVVGRATRSGLPNDATMRVWDQLVPSLASDKGVLLELYNEPDITAAQNPNPADLMQSPDTTLAVAESQTISPAEWQQWADAMNKIIARVRQDGATNVLVADGLDRAIVLTGAPSLTDTLGQIAYAAHPYAFADSDETTAFLDNSFGNFAASHPVIITEWGQGYHCSALDPGFLITFLNYLQTKGVGIEMGTWDWGSAGSFGNARYNFPAAPVFSRFYDNGEFQRCTSSTVTTGKRGPGLTVNQWYTTGNIPTSAL